MRLISCEYQGQTYLGAVRGEAVLLPALAGDVPNDMLALIEAGPAGWQDYRHSLDALPAAYHAPLARWMRASSPRSHHSS